VIEKRSGIQLKSGAVFCLPAKSSHSSRIITPNKRFLEDDYHTVEVSPKKPKVEHLPAAAKKSSISAVPSTYRCPTKKHPQSGNLAAAVAPSPKVEVASSAPAEAESGTADPDRHDTKFGSKKVTNGESTTAQVAEKDEPISKCLAEPGKNAVLVTTESAAPPSTGSILQKPKLCLDQSVVDRSTLAFAKSLQSQIVQESFPNPPSTVRIERNTSPLHGVNTSEKRTTSISLPGSISTPLSSCGSWNSGFGEYDETFHNLAKQSSNISACFKCKM